MSQANQAQSLEALLQGLSCYSIQNLTINSYGPLTMFSGKPNDAGDPQGTPSASQLRATKDEDTVTPQWSWETAHVRLKNDLQGLLRRVTLRHKRGANAGVVTGKTWENLNPGDTTDVFPTDFQSGLFSDYDYWQIELQVEDNGPVFMNDGWKQCNLRDSDKNSEGPVVFKISGETFSINLRSGGDSTSLRAGSLGLNGFAWMQVSTFLKRRTYFPALSEALPLIHMVLMKVENNFTAAAIETDLRHGHDGTPVRTKTWDRPIQPGQSSSPWPVYFKTGDFSNDNWDISVLRDGDRKPHVNARKDKGCWLQAPDNGRIVKIIVRDQGWTMEFPSGSCVDYWDWVPCARKMHKVVEAIDEEWTSDI